jgi:hypothetical protein
MAYLERHKGFGGNQDILYSSQSLDRFVRAANMLKKHDPKAQTSPIHYAFDILANVASPSASWGTKWSIVYDIQNLRVYFRTFANKQIRYVDLHSFDFSCQAPVKVLDMNFDVSGDMTDHFHDYTRKMNLELIRHSFKGTYFLRNIPDGVLEELSKYPEGTCCNEQSEKGSCNNTREAKAPFLLPQWFPFVNSFQTFIAVPSDEVHTTVETLEQQ